MRMFTLVGPVRSMDAWRSAATPGAGCGIPRTRRKRTAKAATVMASSSTEPTISETAWRLARNGTRARTVFREAPLGQKPPKRGIELQPGGRYLKVGGWRWGREKTRLARTGRA